jgi:hypothetical protein
LSFTTCSNFAKDVRGERISQIRKAPSWAPVKRWCAESGCATRHEGVDGCVSVLAVDCAPSKRRSITETDRSADAT